MLSQYLWDVCLGWTSLSQEIRPQISLLSPHWPEVWAMSSRGKFGAGTICSQRAPWGCLSQRDLPIPQASSWKWESPIEPGPESRFQAFIYSPGQPTGCPNHPSGAGLVSWHHVSLASLAAVSHLRSQHWAPRQCDLPKNWKGKAVFPHRWPGIKDSKMQLEKAQAERVTGRKG